MHLMMIIFMVKSSRWSIKSSQIKKSSVIYHQKWSFKCQSLHFKGKMTVLNLLKFILLILLNLLKGWKIMLNFQVKTKLLKTLVKINTLWKDSDKEFNVFLSIMKALWKNIVIYKSQKVNSIKVNKSLLCKEYKSYKLSLCVKNNKSFNTNSRI